MVTLKSLGPSWLMVSTSVMVLVAMPASAQLNGVPLWAPRVPDPLRDHAIHMTLHTTSGDDFVGETGGERGATIAARTWVSGRAMLSGGVGFSKRDVSATERSVRPQFFLSGAVKAVHWQDQVEPTEVVVSEFSGFGYSSLPGPADEKNIPVGVDVAVRIGMGGWFLEPSLFPRWQWRRTDLGAGSGGTWQNGVGGTASLAVKWSDWSVIGAVVLLDLGAAGTGLTALPETTTFAFSLGLQYGR